MVKPYLNNVQSFQQLAQNIASIENEIIAMPNGDQFYAQLQYSLQIVNHYSNKEFRLNKNGKGGPNSFDIEYIEEVGDCWTLVGTFIAAGATVGGGVGSVTIPIVGSVPGAVVGGVVGGIVGGIGCFFQ